MNHTIKQILENQTSYALDIKAWLKRDFKLQKKTLNLIDPEGDVAIEQAKDKLKKKLSKVRIDNVVTSLFFRSGIKKRSKKYYAWWDNENEEVIIYTYATKTIARTRRP